MFAQAVVSDRSPYASSPKRTAFFAVPWSQEPGSTPHYYPTPL